MPSLVARFRDAWNAFRGRTAVQQQHPSTPQGANYQTDLRGWASRVVEKVKVATVGGRLRFLPWYDTYTDETPEQRLEYRKMLRDDAVKAAFQTKVLAVTSLDVQVHPADPDDPRHQDAAEFTRYCFRKIRGGTHQLGWSVLHPAIIDGHAVCEKVWADHPEPSGRWKGKLRWEAVKAKDTRFLQLGIDPYRNITAIRGQGFNAGRVWSPSDFVIFSYFSLFESPAGISDFRAAYRPYWIKDTVWKMRSLYLDKWTGPYFKGSYTTQEQKDALENAFDEARASTWITVPQGALLEAIDLSMRGTADFEACIKDCDKAILIAIVGAHLQILEGQTAGSRGNTKVHKETAELIQWLLAATLADVYEEQMVAELYARNFHDIETPDVSVGAITEQEMLLRAQVDEQLQKIGMKLSSREEYQYMGRTPPDDPGDELRPAGSPPPPPAPPTPSAAGGTFAEQCHCHDCTQARKFCTEGENKGKPGVCPGSGQTSGHPSAAGKKAKGGKRAAANVLSPEELAFAREKGLIRNDTDVVPGHLEAMIRQNYNWHQSVGGKKPPAPASTPEPVSEPKQSAQPSEVMPAIANAVRDGFARHGTGQGTNQVFAAVKQAHPDLAPQQFRKYLVELHRAGEIKLGQYSGNVYNLSSDRKEASPTNEDMGLEPQYKGTLDYWAFVRPVVVAHGEAELFCQEGPNKGKPGVCPTGHPGNAPHEGMAGPGLLHRFAGKIHAAASAVADAVNRVAVRISAASLSDDLLDTMSDCQRIYYASGKGGAPTPGDALGIPLSAGQLTVIGSHVLARATLLIKKKVFRHEEGDVWPFGPEQTAQVVDGMEAMFAAMHKAMPELGPPPDRAFLEEYVKGKAGGAVAHAEATPEPDPAKEDPDPLRSWVEKGAIPYLDPDTGEWLVGDQPDHDGEADEFSEAVDFASSWTGFKSKGGNQGWLNSVTGERRYQPNAPQDRGEEHYQGKKEEKQAKVEAELNATPKVADYVPPDAKAGFEALLPDMPIADTPKLLGALPGATVSLRIYGQTGGRVSFDIEGPRYQDCQRTLIPHPDGSLEVHNDMFFLKKKFQGGGEGTKQFSDQVRACAAAGVDRITTLAGRGRTMNGYATWPILGYDAKLSDAYRAGMPPLPKELASATTIQELFALPGGIDWWSGAKGEDGKRHGGKGVMMDMTFDLSPGSPSIKRLNGYLAKKGLEPIPDPKPADPKVREARKEAVAKQAAAAQAKTDQQSGAVRARESEINQVTTEYHQRVEQLMQMAESNGLDRVEVTRRASELLQRMNPHAGVPYVPNSPEHLERVRAALSRLPLACYDAMNSIVKEKHQENWSQPEAMDLHREMWQKAPAWGLDPRELQDKARNTPQQTVGQSYNMAAAVLQRDIDRAHTEGEGLAKRLGLDPKEARAAAEEALKQGRAERVANPTAQYGTNDSADILEHGYREYLAAHAPAERPKVDPGQAWRDADVADAAWLAKRGGK